MTGFLLRFKISMKTHISAYTNCDYIVVLVDATMTFEKIVTD